jgi:hypothetical protein
MRAEQHVLARCPQPGKEGSICSADDQGLSISRNTGGSALATIIFTWRMLITGLKTNPNMQSAKQISLTFLRFRHAINQLHTTTSI